MAVTVRGVQNNPPDESDKKIGWVDRPIIGEDTYEEGAGFNLSGDGDLFVLNAQGHDVAVHARNSWVSANVKENTNAVG